MTTDNPSENDIDTLALRAKEMLERVRGAAPTDEPVDAGKDTTSSSSSGKASDESTEINADSIETSAEEVEVEETSADVETDDVETDDVETDDVETDDEAVDDVLDEAEVDEQLEQDTDLEDTGLEDTGLEDTDLEDTDLEGTDLLDADSEAFDINDTPTLDPFDEPDSETFEIDDTNTLDTLDESDGVEVETDEAEVWVDDVALENYVEDSASKTAEFADETSTDDLDSSEVTGFEDLLDDDDDLVDLAANDVDTVDLDLEEPEVSDHGSEFEETETSDATSFEDLADDPELAIDEEEISVDDIALTNFAEDSVEDAEIVNDDDGDVAFNDVQFEDVEFDDVEFEDIAIGETDSAAEFSFGGREADAERLSEAESVSLSSDEMVGDIEDVEEIPFDDAPVVDDLEETEDLIELDAMDSDDMAGSASAGLFGGAIDSDVADEPAISTDDLAAEIEDLDPTPAVAGLDLGTELLDDEMQAPVAESGASLASGAAASASTSERAQVKKRDRGRLSDLDSREEPVPEVKSRYGRSRRPKVDHDLNELFLKGDTPQAAPSGRSIGWFLPLIALAIFVLGFGWWAASQTNDSDPDTNEAQPETTIEATTASTTTPTTEATADTSSDDAAAVATTTAEAQTFETAWDLIGASKTGAFGEFAGPLGLQEALEEVVVDADGNPAKFTLLAPSDSAIANLTQEQIDALLADPDAVSELIDYHIIDMQLTPEFLLEDVDGEIISRSGAPIAIGFDDGEVIFNGTARIEFSGLEAQNGSILVIDSVLSPPGDGNLTGNDNSNSTDSNNLNEILSLGNITFETLSSRITPEGQAELDRAVAYFNENPEQSASVEGHTDTDGGAEANLRLSQRRADAVRQYLVDNGISGDRLVTDGFGETAPIIVDGVEDKEASRRIEIILQ